MTYELRALGTFLRWAVKVNLHFANPAEAVERFRVPKKSLPKFMTKDDLSRFFAACDEWERRVFGILLLSGMRKGELVHLEWEDGRFDLGVILIRPKTLPDGSTWNPKSNERAIPMSPSLRNVLLDQRETRRSERLVVANRAGNPETHLLAKMKKVARRAGIKEGVATLHALRHSFGAHLRMAGVPLANIADLMGHQDLATTQIYAKAEIEHLREAVGCLSGLVPEEMTLKNDTPTLFQAQVRRKELETNDLGAGNFGWLGRRETGREDLEEGFQEEHFGVKWVTDWS